MDALFTIPANEYSSIDFRGYILMSPNLPWPKNQVNGGSYVKNHISDIRKAFTFLGNRFVFSFGVTLLLGVSMVLPASLWLFYENLTSIDAEWGGNPGLTVYLKIGAVDKEISIVKRELLSLQSLERITVMYPDRALKEFVDLVNVEELKKLLGANPLPASIQGHFSSRFDYYDLEKLRKKIEDLPHVDDVVLEREWIDNLIKIRGLVSVFLAIYVVLFVIASAFISFTSVKIAIEDRLAEVQILRLVGATGAQIRRPFLYCGVLYGLAGGLFGLVILGFTMNWIYEPLRSIFGDEIIGLRFFGITSNFVPWVLFGGAIVGWFAAMTSVQLQMKKFDLA